MKIRMYIRQSSLLILCLTTSLLACSQTPKMPRTQTSATAKEIVYKPQEGTKDTSAQQKTATPKSKPAQQPPTQQKNKPVRQKAAPDAMKNTTGQTVKDKKATAMDKKPAVKDRKPVSKDKKPIAKDKKPAVKGKPSTAKGKPAAMKKKPETKQKSKTVARPTDRYIALKTNLPFLAVAIQNLALEVQLHKHISLDIPVMWSISDIEREHALRTIAFQPEGRWWLKSVGEGHFFGLHTHVAWFNAKWEQDRYQTGKRPLLGAGISYGYKLPLSAHWGAEFTIGAGYANMKYNTYYNIENGAQLDTRVRHYWGITRAGLSLVYRF